MGATSEKLSVQSVLAALGYEDPMEAARQQARVILLGRIAHYQATIQNLQGEQASSLDDLREQYEAEGVEDFERDDLYLEWQWYADALDVAEAQLAAITAG